MKKLLIYGISLTILACALVLSYKYMQDRLDPEKPALPPARLDNCRNLKINDLKLIAFANKCLLEYGKDKIVHASVRNINYVTCPININDFILPEIKRYTEAEKKRFGLESPDEWTVWYQSKRGYMGGGDYLVRINPVTCECTVSEPR